MTRNATFIAIAALVAAAVWAVAIFAPHAPLRGLDAVAGRGLDSFALRGPSSEAPAPSQAAAVPAPPSSAAPEPTRSAAAPMDPAVFGGLPADMRPPAPPLPMRLMENGGAPKLPSSALASQSLNTIGSTFSESSLGASLPQLGGASALDGPADAGLDERVGSAALPEPPVPPPSGKIIALDASEGTKLDPLRQRNWDLNAVQQIPAFTPQR